MKTLFLAIAATALGGPPETAHPNYFEASFTVERVLDWGERPEWSPDGQKLAFVQSDVKDGPAYELDLSTRKVRCLTCRWGANGRVTRIYYLPDGSFLILGPPGLDTASAKRGEAAHSDQQAGALYWMPASLAMPPQPLGSAAWGELGMQRSSDSSGTRIAWGNLSGSGPQLLTGQLVNDGYHAALADRRVVYTFDAKQPRPGAPSFAEAYNLTRDGRRAVFWSVDPASLDSGMYELDLETGAVRALAPDPAHNETHLFADERFGLEESNRASDPDGALRGVSGLEVPAVTAIARAFGFDLSKVGKLEDYAPRPPLKGVARPFDLFVVALDGSTPPRRLTQVSHLGGNAHQSVPNDDGTRIAFALQAPQTGPFRNKGGLYVGTFATGSPTR